MNTEPVTVGDLRRAGELLHAFCVNQLNNGPAHSRYCGHGVYVDPNELRTRAGRSIPDDFPVPELNDMFRCTKCGAKNSEMPGMPITVRGDTRPPKMGM